MAAIGRFWLSAAVSLTAIAGCQAVQPSADFRQAAFTLGQGDAPVATAARPTASHSGELRVSFADMLGQLRQRRILSTIADVDHVVVTVTPAGGAAVTQTVAKAAIAAGQSTVSFAGLAVGGVEVKVLVYDATGAILGTSTRQATVVAGQVATVDLFVQLPATVVSNGGGSPASNGDLSANVFIQDGAVITNLPGGGTLERYKLPSVAVDVDVDSTGAAWVLVESGQLPGFGNVVYKLSPTGAVTLRLTLPGNTGSIVVDAHDHVWAGLALPDDTFRMGEWDSNGVQVNDYAMPSGLGGLPNFTFDGDQTFYVPFMGTAAIKRWTIGDVAIQDMPGSSFCFGKNADLWVTDYPNILRHTTRTGDVLDTVTLDDGYYTGYSDVDATGNVWMGAYQYESGETSPAKNGKVVQLSPSGVTLKSTALTQGVFPSCIQIAPSGTIWVLETDWGINRHATWLDANGDVKGRVEVGYIDPTHLAVGSSGAWMLDFSGEIVRVAPSGF